MPDTTPDTTSETTATAPASPATVAAHTKKTTTVSQESTTTTGPAKAGTSNKPRAPRSASTKPTSASNPPAQSTTADDKPASPGASNRQRAEELQQRLEQFRDYPQLRAQVKQMDEILRGVLDDPENKYLVSLHTTQIAGIERAIDQTFIPEIAKISVLERNQEQLGQKHNRLVGRVSAHDRMLKPFKFPTWSLLLALVAGIIAGFIWNGIEFKSPVVGLPNTEPQYYLDFRNDLYMAFVFGLLVFSVVVAIFLVIALIKYSSEVRKDQPQQVTEQDSEYAVLETTEPAIPRNPNPVTAEQSVGVAPTEPQRAAQGVHAGAR